MGLVQCKKCGREVEDTESFCPDCGCPIDHDQASSEQMPKKEQNSNKMLRILLPVIAAVIIVIVIAVSVVSVINRKSGGQQAEAPKVFVDKAGCAYMNKSGTMIKIKGNYVGGASSVDQKHIALLDKDGGLTCYEVKNAKKKKVAGDVKEIIAVRDKGIVFLQKAEDTVEDILQAIVDDYESETNLPLVKKVFRKKYKEESVANAKKMYKGVIGERYDSTHNGSHVFRYMFDSKEAQELGEGECKTAVNTLSLIYTDYEDIYIWQEDAKEKIEVSPRTTDTKLELQAISDKGNLAVWSETDDDDTKSVYMAEDGKKEKIAQIDMDDLDNDNVLATFINKDTEVVLFNLGDDNIYRKKIGKETVKMNAGGAISGSVFSENQLLYLDKGKISDLYVEAADDEDYEQNNLYCLQPDGNREKILSNIKAVQAICDGKVFYIDKDDELYVAKLGRKDVTNKKKISSDVDSATVSADSSIVYFEKDYDDETGTHTLYSCKIKGVSPEPEKIDSDVYKESITADGKTVVYMKDATRVPGTTNYYGELYEKKWGKTAKKISSDVISIYGNHSSTYVDKKDLFFFKYTTKDDKDKILGNYVQYNGRTTKELAKDIYYE